MITIDELFAEDFKPEWMTHDQRVDRELREKQRELERLALQRTELTAARRYSDYVGRRVDRDYSRYAAECRARIASRCDNKGNYTNASKEFIRV